MNEIIDAIILIVDDEIGITRLTQRLLKRAGYHVLAVNRPQDALDYLNQEKVDLMLVDIRMPEMDGFQLMEIARGIQPELAVVIMTGYGTVETAVESLRKGADGMVLKPFTGVELVQSIEQALREKRSQREIQRLRVLRPLFDITETLFSEQDPDRLKKLILDIALDRFDCSNINVYQQIDDQFELFAGIETESFDDRFWSIFEQAVKINAPVFLNVDAPENYEYKKLLEERDIGSLVCVPNTSNRGISLLVAIRLKDDRRFSVADQEMLLLFSRQAAIAMENAFLYHDLQDHVKQVEQSQQALIQAEKMAAVGRLTASIAHEINNPLQAVQNCLHIIQNGNLSDPELDNYMGLVAEELDRLKSAAKRMLDYYRPGALHRYPTTVADLIEAALSLIEKQIVRQNITLSKQYAPDLPEVMVVANQLQQVIFNLVLNAMEAMPSGGELTIQTKHIDNQVIIGVKDSGPGVLESERKSIFEPFVSTKEDGLGLGLTVSYGIITAHGGTLEVLPQQDVGSNFQITLPAGG
jgi:signal transduction histidine kinase